MRLPWPWLSFPRNEVHRLVSGGQNGVSANMFMLKSLRPVSAPIVDAIWKDLVQHVARKTVSLICFSITMTRDWSVVTHDTQTVYEQGLRIGKGKQIWVRIGSGIIVSRWWVMHGPLIGGLERCSAKTQRESQHHMHRSYQHLLTASNAVAAMSPCSTCVFLSARHALCMSGAQAV